MARFVLQASLMPTHSIIHVPCSSKYGHTGDLGAMALKIAKPGHSMALAAAVYNSSQSSRSPIRKAGELYTFGAVQCEVTVCGRMPGMLIAIVSEMERLACSVVNCDTPLHTKLMYTENVLKMASPEKLKGEKKNLFRQIKEKKPQTYFNISS